MDANRPIAENRSASRLKDILLLVGRLNYTWTNTESLLIHLIAGLARVDKETAIIIFLTLNTTRARTDLVERLAKMKSTPAECRREILAATRALSAEGRLRNKYNHCIYSFDEDGAPAMTQLMRIVDGKEEVRYGKAEILDDAEIGRISDSIDALVAINRNIWQLTHRYGFPT